MDKKTYYADVRIFVQAESAEEAAQEINDAVQYAVHSSGFALTAYDIVVDMDMQECKTTNEENE
jgi:predicted ATPase with chaperone activity